MLKKKEIPPASAQNCADDRIRPIHTIAESKCGAENGEDAPPSPFTNAFPVPFFETESLRRQLEELRRAIVADHKVLLVEGERGSGKTTLLRELCARAAGTMGICRVEAPMAIGEKLVLDRLGQSLFGETLAQRDLLAHLIVRARRGPVTLIVVDDADNLSAFAVKALLDLKRGVSQAGGRIGLVLAARPLTVESIFAAPSFLEYREQWLTPVTLEPFTDQETADYIRHRLAAAGVAEESALDAAKIRAIHRHANGLPGYINRLAREALSGGRIRQYRTERHERQLAQRRRIAMAAGGSGLLLLALVYVFYVGLIRPSALEREIARASLSFGAGADRVAGLPPALTEEAGEDGVTDSESNDTIAELNEIRPAVLEGGADTEAAGADLTAQSRERTVPTPTPVAARQSPRAATESEVQAKTESQPASPAALEVTGPATDSEPPSALSGNAWLMAQDPDRYTIQLAGTPEEAKAQEFIDKYPLNGEVRAVRTARSGRIRFVVLYNSYTSAGAAQRDIAALPPEVQKNGPFVRRLSSVQSMAAGD